MIGYTTWRDAIPFSTVDATAMHGGQAWQPLLNRETTILRSAALPTFSGISPHFRPRRHLMNTPEYRAEMTIRFAIWDEATGVAGLPAEA